MVETTRRKVPSNDCRVHTSISICDKRKKVFLSLLFPQREHCGNLYLERHIFRDARLRWKPSRFAAITSIETPRGQLRGERGTPVLVYFRETFGLVRRRDARASSENEINKD